MTETANTKTVWVRTRSGNVISFVSVYGNLSFDGSWKRAKLDERVLKLLARQNTTFEVSLTQPGIVAPPKAVIPYQTFNLSLQEADLCVNNTVTGTISYVPENCDINSVKVDALSDNLKICSVDVLPNKRMFQLVGHKAGTTNIVVAIGSKKCTIAVTVREIPYFEKQEYTGVVGEEIELKVVNAVATLTVPENVSVVKDTTVVASKAGSYEILGSAHGVSFTTRLVVSEPEVEESEEHSTEGEATETPTE